MTSLGQLDWSVSSLIPLSYRSLYHRVKYSGSHIFFREYSHCAGRKQSSTDGLGKTRVGYSQIVTPICPMEQLNRLLSIPRSMLLAHHLFFFVRSVQNLSEARLVLVFSSSLFPSCYSDLIGRSVGVCRAQ